ncbi:MAG: hypothetical protein QOI61_402 [Actinomycetota bacterium]
MDGQYLAVSRVTRALLQLTNRADDFHKCPSFALGDKEAGLNFLKTKPCQFLADFGLGFTGPANLETRHAGTIGPAPRATQGFSFRL